MGFIENLGSVDQVAAGISREVVPAVCPCPTCGKEMKDANTRGSKKAGLDLRICSAPSCRVTADWSAGSPALEYPPVFEDPEPTVTVVAPVAVQLVPYACPQCKRATKDDNTPETKEAGLDVRICSSRTCRAKADWSTGSPVPYSG